MLKINELARLYLGIQGENGVRSITVDVSAWINLYPNGSVTVWHKRCGDSTPSPTGAVYDSEEQTVTWDITSVDTFVAGIGEAEFRLIENEVIKKTVHIMTGVSPSVTQAGTTLGSDWQSYINAVDSLRAGAVVAQEAAEDAQEAAEDAKEAAEDAQEAAENAQTAAETAQGKAEDAQTAAEAAAARAEHASKVMVPAGGTEGQRLAKKSGTDFDMEWKTDPYYTKPAGGIPASDMAEGAIPDPEDVIDDTAGAGDTDKTWSADKLTSDVLSAISAINTATVGDVGKYFKVKTVTDGKIAEVEFDDPSGGGSFSGIIELDTENQTAELSEELASGTGWVLGSGWTGSFAEGFTHSSGTDALEFPISGNEEGKMYIVSFKSSVDATVTPNFYVTIGGSDQFPLYGMPQPYHASIVSKGTANLKFIPITSYTGKISEISIKEVTAISVPYMVTLDTDEHNAIEFRSGTKQLGNIFIGRNAGQWNVTGFGNTAIGDEALSHVIGGFWNTGLGITALRENTNGSRNVGVGYGALQANISGHRNIALGTFALISNTTGYQNVAVGADSMDKNISGYNNVALGFQAMYNVTSGYENIAIGSSTAGQLTTGARNIIIGQYTLAAITTQSYNIGIGYSCMPTTTGSYNVGIGMNTLYRNTGGQYNVAIGYNAGYGSNSASYTRNVIIGPQAGDQIYNSVTANVLIGYLAGHTLVSGSDNVCIGHSADVPASSTSNYTDINGQVKGSKATGSEWTQVLGDLIVMGKDGVKRQIVFNNDNTVSWVAVT